MTDLVDQLFKKPKKDKGVNAPRFLPTTSGHVHQADLLFLPDDKGFKYALVVVDVGSRKTDAEPIKNKDGSTIIKAFEKIYKRPILSLPKVVQVDDGSEFKGLLSLWLKKNNVDIRVAKTGRHRQQALVERRNQIIGRELFKRMTAQELLTGQTSTQWIDELPKVLQKMNAKASTKHVKLSNEYQCQGEVCTLLNEGDKVRVALEYPIDIVTGKRLNGRFRDSDIRWEIKPRTVKRVILQPNQPPLYLVSDNQGNTDHRQAYTKNQLLPVRDDEKQPDASLIVPIDKKKGKNVYIANSIVDKKKENNKVYYRVRWKGFEPEDDTWEPRTQLMEDTPELVQTYEASLRRK